MLYRRDICLLGGGINAISKKRSGLFSTVYESELFLGNKVFPCMATFNKFLGAYKIIFKDKKSGEDVLDYYFLFLRDHPKFLFEYTLRHLIRFISLIAMFICLLYSTAEIRVIPCFFLLYILRFILTL